MSNRIGFEFPLDSSGQWDGFNEPGMEHFAGNPLEHLGRETVQNSLDARISPEHPARVTFSLIEVSTAEIPGFEELREAIGRCAAAATDESPRAVQFFETAKAQLARRKVRVLQVSDTRTTGVTGPCTNGRPYYALMKATGQSRKTSVDATGSFGIGKFAPYTVSSLRTVFVTTVWGSPSNHLQHYVQGKSILMSHCDTDGEVRRGTGFWGVRRGCMPVDTCDGLPGWLRRDDLHGRLDANSQGTTLHIFGFAAQKKWRQILAASIAENFFGAVHRGQLEVDIDGQILITRETLGQLLSDLSIEEAMSTQKGEPEKFRCARDYLRTLGDSSEITLEESQQLHLGSCELRILVGEGLPKGVAVLRNGMFITDELSRLRSFSNFKEFAAVLECNSERGNELLRAMEPPRHDDFEPDRLPAELARKGRVALYELTKWVRSMLQRHAIDPVSDVTTIDELTDYFADETDEGQPSSREEDPAGGIIIRARRRLTKKDNRTAWSQREGNGESPGDGAGEADGAEGGRSSERNDSGGNSTDFGHGETDIGGRTALLLGNVRAIPLSSTVRRVAFTPVQSGTLRLQLQDSGADTNRRLRVLAASAGRVVDGEITGLEAAVGERIMLEVELESAFNGTLKVAADAV
ncbi:MAG: hypothetical protein EOS10_11645 [Mesorhizobium sp.]|uniref:hypothetical protein n=1 Tax=Mesorhizobium sp. TaxID=1871066 RepID=UPI000FE80A79|nr:hypothetical protein [Mesorhizobium sp.]RWO32345.1 MAG: hypothetical protein EOS10_11645 [Mesorhizobium sp.]